MKILFIQPSAGFLMRGTTYPVCRSIMVTASYMKSIGHEVKVFDRCIDFSKAEKVFDAFSPEAVVVYVPPTASVKDAVYLSELAKKHNAFVVWCEVVAAAFAEYIVLNRHSDFVITGETEAKLKSLIDEIDKGKNFESIPGLTYLKDGVAVSNKNENNTNLDVIPEIDWELVDVEKCFRQFPHCKKMLYMYTSRGCPFKCTYCYNTMYYNSVHRKRPIHYVLNEIRYLERNHGLDGVNFSDELLLLNDDEIKAIADFRKENKLNFFWAAKQELTHTKILIRSKRCMMRDADGSFWDLKREVPLQESASTNLWITEQSKNLRICVPRSAFQRSVHLSLASLTKLRKISGQRQNLHSRSILMHSFLIII